MPSPLDGTLHPPPFESMALILVLSCLHLYFDRRYLDHDMAINDFLIGW
jgi:hypothetical protein